MPEAPRFLGILVGILLISGAAFGYSSPTAQGTPTALADCPTLRFGDKDPLDGKWCVTELQMLLKAQGVTQKVTGNFGSQTKKNVQDFQRRHNIEATGNVANKTRKALRESSKPSPEVPDVPRSSFSRGTCTTQQCDFYVSRTATHRYADWLTRHPVATSAVTTAILGTVCKIFKLSIAVLACQVFADVHVERLKAALISAARQNACLHITITRNTLRSRLTFGTDNSAHCEY